MKQKKKIIYYSNHLRGPFGAAGARSWHQVKALSNKFNITVIIPGIDPVTAQKVTEETYHGLNESKVDIVKISTLRNDRRSVFSRTLYYASAMFGQIKVGLIASSPSLVISMGLPLTTLLAAFIVSKIKKIPFIIDVRDLPFDMAEEIGYLKKNIITTFMKKTESFILRQSTEVVTNSPWYVSYLVEKGVPKNRITVALIGYDNFEEKYNDKILDKILSESSLKINDRDNKIFCCYAGTLGFAFPVFAILEAMKMLGSLENFIFVCIGDGQQMEELVNFSEINKLPVIFTGRLSKTFVHSIISEVDFCFYPSNEGEFSAAILGNKIYDYIGGGKPVLYSGPNSAVSELITDLDVGVCCEVNNCKSLAENLDRMINDAEFRANITPASDLLVNKGLTASHSAQSMLKCVEKYI